MVAFIDDPAVHAVFLWDLFRHLTYGRPPDTYMWKEDLQIDYAGYLVGEYNRPFQARLSGQSETKQDGATTPGRQPRDGTPTSHRIPTTGTPPSSTVSGISGASPRAVRPGLRGTPELPVIPGCGESPPAREAAYKAFERKVGPTAKGAKVPVGHIGHSPSKGGQ